MALMSDNHRTLGEEHFTHGERTEGAFMGTMEPNFSAPELGMSRIHGGPNYAALAMVPVCSILNRACA